MNLLLESIEGVDMVDLLVELAIVDFQVEVAMVEGEAVEPAIHVERPAISPETVAPLKQAVEGVVAMEEDLPMEDLVVDMVVATTSASSAARTVISLVIAASKPNQKNLHIKCLHLILFSSKSLHLLHLDP